MIAALFAAALVQATPDPALAPYTDERGSVRVQGSRRIHLVCMGASSKGRPTVILTAGAGGWSADWRRVQPEIARRARVCAWDRAGAGLSDASPAAQAVTETTRDMERALTAGRVRGPYVLVAHSSGSYETLLFADRHRARLAGMVLVDPSLPDQFARFAVVAPIPARESARYVTLAADYARGCAGALRGGDGVLPERCPPANPDPTLAARERDPARFDTAASYWAELEASARAAINPQRSYGAVPLIVLTAGRGFDMTARASDTFRAQVRAQAELWVKGHDEIAALSTRGVNRIIPNSGHTIQRDDPAAVIAAIGEVLDAASTIGSR